ncbi:hypothetical protein AAHC03_026908 [Spirometra sp. Aus1]
MTALILPNHSYPCFTYLLRARSLENNDSAAQKWPFAVYVMHRLLRKKRGLTIGIFNRKPSLHRQYATPPSAGRHPAPGGECTVDHKLPFSRHVQLAPSIKKVICASNDLRDEFLSFFQDRGHKIVAPSSVYPRRQEGSYFVNAGMNQFKELFLRTHETESEFTRLRRAVNSQPCIRIGGRHDDLNDVGYDTYHHTMFEMLGNWSFGDYGKKTACSQMWKFLREVLGLPANSLYVTYFGGCPELDLPADDETRDIWLALGVSDQKLMPFGFDYNFWRADQATGGGLCGPATEIHVDYRALSGTEDLSCARCLVNSGNPQVVELWNCVFITHRLLQDSLGKNRLLPLPNLNVDTGMGLERLASVMQGAMTTYDTDIFSPLMSAIEMESKNINGSSPCPYQGHFHRPKPAREDSAGTSMSDAQASSGHFSSLIHSLFSRHKTQDEKEAVTSTRQPLFAPLLRDVAYRVLADHSRALALALQDGLLPGRQGVQLKLRHLIYRASRAAILSDLDSPERPQLLGRLVAEIVRTASRVNLASDVQGPSARRPSAVTPDQASGIINQELHEFAPRLMKMEAAFQTCLDEMGPNESLTAEQVDRLLSGHYGAPISWDMLCAQARWYGLQPPPAPQTPSGGTPLGASRGTRKTARVHRAPTRAAAATTAMLADLSASQVAGTDDSPKYAVDRISGSAALTDRTTERVSYVVQPILATLSAIVLPTNLEDSASPRVVHDPSQLGQTLSTLTNSADVFGLVFDSTNFFSPSGGQASDTGHIICPTSKKVLFEVESIERCRLEGKHDGWVVHWVRSPADSTASVPTSLQFLLSPEKNRRSALTMHHTAQHVLNWAFAEEMKQQPLQTQQSSDSMRTDGMTSPADSPSTFHYGSRVEPDRFYVKLTVLTEPSVGDAEDLSFLQDLICRAEKRCRDVIEADLPISVRVMPWSEISKIRSIRRYPWEVYPPSVRVVCIGDLADTHFPQDSLHSAELCGGTHLQRTGDLEDIVVVAVRSRDRSIKEFVAIAGSRAREARRHGSGLLSRIRRLETLSASAPADAGLARELQLLAADIDGVLGQHLGGHLHSALPFLQRCEIEESRARLSGLLGRVKASLKARGQNLLETDLINALSNTSAGDVDPLTMEFAFDKVNKLAQALMKLSPPRPVLLFHEGLAIFYDAQGNGAALEWAKRTAGSLRLPEPLIVRPEAFKDPKNDPQAAFAVMRLTCPPDSNSEWHPTWRQFREELYRAARLTADARFVSSSSAQRPL